MGADHELPDPAPPAVASERRAAWGRVSLAAAIATPLLIVVASLSRSGIPLAVGRLTIVATPAAAILAVVAGRRSGQGQHDPLAGRWGFALGVIEVVLIAVFVLFSVLAWDQITESL